MGTKCCRHAPPTPSRNIGSSTASSAHRSSRSATHHLKRSKSATLLPSGNADNSGGATEQSSSARLPLPWIAGFLLRPHMKYVEKHFTLRIHRRDGTSKLFLG